MSKLDKYYALFKFSGECVSGVNIYYNYVQEIAEKIAEGLTGYINDEMFENPCDERRAKEFIKKTANKKITLEDLKSYFCETSIGSENIIIIGSDSSTIITIAKELFLLSGREDDLEELLKDGSFDEDKICENFDPVGQLIFQLYRIGLEGKMPDQKLLDDIGRMLSF